MTNEEKQLLLADLCARLPYGVKLETDDGVEILDTLIVSNGWINASYDIDEVKPYLRPMSSMTEEEKEKLLSIIREETHIICEKLKNNDCGIEEGKYHFYNILELDFLLSHHFDYRGLIDKGLALEAPEGMYH